MWSMIFFVYVLKENWNWSIFGGFFNTFLSNLGPWQISMSRTMFGWLYFPRWRSNDISLNKINVYRNPRKIISKNQGMRGIKSHKSYKIPIIKQNVPYIKNAQKYLTFQKYFLQICKSIPMKIHGKKGNITWARTWGRRPRWARSWPSSWPRSPPSSGPEPCTLLHTLLQ